MHDVVNTDSGNEVTIHLKKLEGAFEHFSIKT